MIRNDTRTIIAALCSFTVKKCIFRSYRILRLTEAGFLKIIKRHWLISKIKSYKINKMEAIRMDQVLLMNIVIRCDVMAALLILAIEKIVHARKLKLS
jgi:hypothetical protein